MLRIDAAATELTALASAPHVIPRPDVVLRVEGPGALACMQGLFTNDIERAGVNALCWGAVLTPKGMIITDLWVWRRAADLLLIVPEAGAGRLRELLRKSFPPRLASVSALQHELAVWWLTAGDAPASGDLHCVRPVGPAPFHSLVIAPPTAAPAAFSQAGWQMAPAVAGDALAVLHGWPMLGREIDDRTLVQEVRFDELQGVRYDKGCFVGQETVSRLHFRGHPNRTLRGIVGRGAAPADDQVMSSEGRDLGAVATLLAVGGQWIASVKLRREANTGDRVMVGGHAGVVRDFPIALHDPP